MTEASGAGWVSLSEAARILGVHPATVRGWADRGLLPSQRTPGGHRRFRRADLQQWLEGQNPPPNAEAQLLVQSAMGRVRMELGEGNLFADEWYRQMDPVALDQMRLLGRRLMEVLQRFLASSSNIGLAEARAVGLDYGRVIRVQRLTLGQAVEGFFAFNDFLVEAAVQIAEVGRAERSDVMRKVYSFTREIILALVDAYAE